ncbi:MAG: hypothetical protein J0L84_11000 [Verrucomicrobia bacterium]|nr:hypothetical protein [Verrucomicrobiota bacterium]
MNDLEIRLDHCPNPVPSGTWLRGTIVWPDLPPRASGELRIGWVLEFKGPREVGIAQIHRLIPGTAGSATRFEVRLPSAPWSYSGLLSRLSWFAEVLVNEDGRHHAHVRFDMSPAGHPILLGDGGSETPP